MTTSREETTPKSPATAVPVDAFGRVEARGIEFVPAAERGGNPRELFAVWAASNIAYIYVVLGGTLLLLGLSLWQALAVVVVGNAFWLGVGLLAVSGPAAGTPGVVVMRSMFGIRGNRVFGAGLSWTIAISYEAINLSFGSLAGFALAEHLGASLTTPTKLLILGVIATLTFTISIYGHATIVRLSPIFTAVLVLCCVLLGAFVFGHADAGYVPAQPLSGAPMWSAVLVGVAIVASAPLSWTVGADYARYLPEGTSPKAVLAWTALGGFVPAVALGVIGVAAGTSVDMTDPQTSLGEILPGWFYPVFLAVIVAGSITTNVLTTYSSGLCLQAIGVRLRRSRSVLIDGVIGGAITYYALFVADDFLATLSRYLELTVAVLGPLVAVYATDIVLRRNRYDGPALTDESPSSPHWYTSGFGLPGIAALLLGVVSAGLCVSTTSWQGPVAAALGGADLSVLVGPAVAAIVYTVLVRATSRAPR
ncbi:MAG: Cytosine/purine/uracil/thiamine/allantoin permease family protein [uncultured Corynebacteriales bacterium]|uniref:Cytosine/purine/uracil/thiamine/allantoin permease family protein n=1 Tax=uncultured Mycobacteriales bacterium TaxID=581187 RepID=A0A6J4J7M0_9ACTN|nr:MAG: Cytosine/purine/uracil/thiamine/allantoin permease family protein [uncultured Corynebacteriales bacterium]